METKHYEIGSRTINIGKAKVLAVKELENKAGGYIGTEDVTFQNVHATPDGYVFTVSGGGLTLDVWVELQKSEHIDYPLARSKQPIQHTTQYGYGVWSCPA